MRTSTPDLLLADDDVRGVDNRTDDDTVLAGLTYDATIDGEFVVEAPSVTAAVADVEARTGRRPEVLDIERLAKGGIGGFFAREIVRVRVRLEPVGAPSSARPTAPPAAVPASVARDRVTEARPSGVDGVLQALARETDERERNFEVQLRAALRNGQPVRPQDLRTAPAAPPVEASLSQEPAAGPLFATHPPRVAPPDRAVGRVIHDQDTGGTALEVRPWRPGAIEPAAPGAPTVVRSSSVRVAAPAAAPESSAPEGAAPGPSDAPIAEAVAAPVSMEPDEPTAAREETPTRHSTRSPLIPASVMARIVGEDLPADGDADIEEVAPASDDDVIEGVLVDEGPPQEAPEASPGSAASAPDPTLTSPAPPKAPEPARTRRAQPTLARGVPLAPARSLPVGSDWSREALHQLGVPGALLDRLEVPRGSDELLWMRAVAEAVLPWCRPLPSGSSILAGPRAATIGEALGVPVCEKGQRPPYGGDVALVASDGQASFDWMQDVRGDRWLHLVAGGRRWEGLLSANPRAVSLVGREEMARALSLCVSFDLGLGHLARNNRDQRVMRITPLDVAMALRDELPRVEGA